jgi:hypothetical protein
MVSWSILCANRQLLYVSLATVIIAPLLTFLRFLNWIPSWMQLQAYHTELWLLKPHLGASRMLLGQRVSWMSSSYRSNLSLKNRTFCNCRGRASNGIFTVVQRCIHLCFTRMYRLSLGTQRGMIVFVRTTRHHAFQRYNNFVVSVNVQHIWPDTQSQSFLIGCQMESSNLSEMVTLFVSSCCHRAISRINLITFDLVHKIRAAFLVPVQVRCSTSFYSGGSSSTALKPLQPKPGRVLWQWRSMIGCEQHWAVYCQDRVTATSHTPTFPWNFPLVLTWWDRRLPDASRWSSLHCISLISTSYSLSGANRMRCIYDAKYYLCAKIWPFLHVCMRFFIAQAWTKKGSATVVWIIFPKVFSTKSSDLWKKLFHSVLLVRLLIGYVLVIINKQHT